MTGVKLTNFYSCYKKKYILRGEKFVFMSHLLFVEYMFQLPYL